LISQRKQNPVAVLPITIEKFVGGIVLKREGRRADWTIRESALVLSGCCKWTVPRLRRVIVKKY
jgi:hypothetical protein